jgi:elongation factor Ts
MKSVGVRCIAFHTESTMLRTAFRSAFIASNNHSRYLAAAAAASVKVPTDLLKQLRERTGSPMMECKNALVDANLDIEKAVDVLRKKGAVHASKAAGRQASCGLVATAVSSDHQSATVVELNCETDFVERNERFQVALHAVVNGTLQLVPGASASANAVGVSSLDLAQVNAAKTSEGTSVGDTVNMLISAIRENIVLRRASTLSVPSGVVGAYVHNTVRPSLGRVASLVALKTSSPAVTAQPETKAALLALADKLAMHTAGVKPLYTNRASVPKDVVDREEGLYIFFFSIQF